MNLSSILSLLRGIGYLLVITLSMNCQKDDSTNISKTSGVLPGADIPTPDAILSQTRTASQFNNVGSYLNLWSQLGAQYVAVDDNSYAFSKKLSSQRGFLMILLQGFNFDIPSDAVIENIIVSARRFKTGKGLVKDYFATLLTPNEYGNNRAAYGIYFTNPGYYPTVETEVLYSQTGTGVNGGLNGNLAYQWMPAMINDPSFGVRIDVFVEKASVVVYYDAVSITVEYSVP